MTRCTKDIIFAMAAYEITISAIVAGDIIGFGPIKSRSHPIVAPDAPTLLAGSQGDLALAVLFINAVFPACLGHGNPVVGTPLAVAAITRGGGCERGSVISKMGEVFGVVAIGTPHCCFGAPWDIAFRMGGMAKGGAGTTFVAVTGVTAGCYRSLMAKFIRSVFVTRITGPTTIVRVFVILVTWRIGTTAIISIILGVLMTDLADPIIVRLTCDIGPEDGWSRTTALGPFDLVSYKGEVGRLPTV
ncbi:MAG: hypothetical protein SWQ30_21385 [Thermodesulfobacteriota bacterium]|nr:hypothetical protein [Thermodesulfobacteriota bacterium]